MSVSASPPVAVVLSHHSLVSLHDGGQGANTLMKLQQLEARMELLVRA